jgi:tetratricopeptide (TPR) repeat protein
MQNALNWQHYAEFAESAYNKGSFEVADNLIRLALSCAAPFADGDYRYISTLEHLGDVLVARSKAHDACENYTRAYNLLKKFHGLASLNALRLQIKYGRVLIELGQTIRSQVCTGERPKIPAAHTWMCQSNSLCL